LPKDAPVLVFIHGGFWQGMNKFTSAYAVKPFVEAGARVITVDHDLCPDVTLEDVVKQFQKAAEFIINQAAANRAKSVSFIGHLSGAHLITSILQKNFIDLVGPEKFKIVKNAYLISGIYDLKELKDTKCANRDNLLSLNDLNVTSLSPINGNFHDLKEFSIKFSFFVGGDESPTLQQQSSDMVKHLSSFGLNAIFKTIENVDHFNIAEKLSENDYEITKSVLSNL
jgi:arylformamidase